MLKLLVDGVSFQFSIKDLYILPGIPNITFSPPEFYFCQGGKASEIAFKPSCDTDSQTRTSDIILGLVALKDGISYHSYPVVGKLQDA